MPEADQLNASLPDPQPTRSFAIAVWSVLFLSMLGDLTLPYRWASSFLYEAGSVVVLTALVFGWFLADARQNDVETSWGLKVAVLLLSAIALPYYRFRYQGARAGFLFIARVVAGVLVAAICATAIAWLIQQLPDFV